MRQERDEEREGGEESEYMSKFSLIPRPLVGETAWYMYLQLTYTNSLNPGKLLGHFFIVFFFVCLFVCLFLLNDLGTIKARVPYMYFFDQTSRLLFISLLVLCGYYLRVATTMYLRAAFISLESFEMSTTA